MTSGQATIIELDAAGTVYFNGQEVVMESSEPCWGTSAGIRASLSGPTGHHLAAFYRCGRPAETTSPRRSPFRPKHAVNDLQFWGRMIRCCLVTNRLVLPWLGFPGFCTAALFCRVLIGLYNLLIRTTVNSSSSSSAWLPTGNRKRGWKRLCRRPGRCRNSFANAEEGIRGA